MTTEQILATTLALERLQRYADERAMRLAQYHRNWDRKPWAQTAPAPKP